MRGLPPLPLPTYLRGFTLTALTNPFPLLCPHPRTATTTAHGGCTEAAPDPTASRGRCEGAATTLQPLGSWAFCFLASVAPRCNPKRLQRVPVPPFCPCHSPEVPSAGAGRPPRAHPWGSGPQEAAGAHWRPLGTPRAPPKRGHHQQPRSPSPPAAPRGDAGHAALLAPFLFFF